MKVLSKTVLITLCLLVTSLSLTTGCSEEKASVTDEQKMRDAMKGKGVGEMPPEVRAKMEAAMKANATTEKVEKTPTKAE